jgi:hypothetical protein
VDKGNQSKTIVEVDDDSVQSGNEEEEKEEGKDEEKKKKRNFLERSILEQTKDMCYSS